MLTPRDRTLLLEALHTPDGFRLDQAVGTTFTLDLMALLTVPLAFTFAHWDDDEGRPTLDPVALIHALREHARRMHIFCQAGEIRAPGAGQPLFTALEPSVIEARAPKPGGLFHPKAWVLRFTNADGDVMYRVLVASRNLTFDRSWDTLLVLEGSLTGRSRNVRDSVPLGDFVAALPDLALRRVPQQTRQAILDMAGELRRVRFDPPEPFKELHFHPFGVAGRAKHWPYEGAFKGVVVSPFVGDEMLADLLDTCEDWNRREVDLQLISRPESLVGLSREVVERFSSCWMLSADADPEDGVEESEGGEAFTTDDALTGLHAKLVVLHRDHYAHVFTGSANATVAAHQLNVEFMVELVGGREKCGLPALMGSDGDEGKGTLRELLEPWEPVDTEPDAEQELINDLDRRLARARLAVGTCDLILNVAPTSADDRGDVTYDVDVTGAMPEMPAGVRVVCWLATQVVHCAVEPAKGDTEHVARFTDIALIDLTAFLAFECVASEGGVERRSRFARHLPLVGAPDDREERLLRAMLNDREKVMQLLLMLLAADDTGAPPPGLADGAGLWSRWGGPDGVPLLESLVGALARDPLSLEPVRRLVDDLRRTEEGAELLPDGFGAIWAGVEAAAGELRK